MKKRRISIFIFLFLQLFSVQLCFAKDSSENLPEGCTVVYQDIPYGQTTLKATFYCFDDLETGQKVADILYRKMNLKKELKKGGFKKLIPVPVGSAITAYNYSVMSYGREFWFFENRDDGWLWGTGRY